MALQPQRNRNLSEFSTFGIGGPIRYFLSVSSVEEMEEALHFAKQEHIPYLVLGKGSNCLFDDRGYAGLVILNKIDFCQWQDSQVFVGAGYSFSLLGVQSARQGFSGLEFASGIPATVGGAIFMNAGANGHETKDVLRSVLYLMDTGEKKTFLREGLSFSYRKSPFQSMQGIILGATFALEPQKEARQKQLQIVDYRMKTQPLKEKSIGCIFRNPHPSQPAGALIQNAGLKGFQIGGAKVSEIHANFIVNAGQATAQDVLALIQTIQQRVGEQSGIHLEPEIRIVPYE